MLKVLASLWMGFLVICSSWVIPAWSQVNPDEQYLQLFVYEEPRAPLKSPQAILDDLKVANQIPTQIASQIRIVKSPQLNAATDGVSIVLTDTLWNTLKTDDQRAFVISHELSHIVLNHIQKTNLRRLGLGAVDRYVIGRYIQQGSLWDLVGDIGFGLIDRKFSRDVEYSADDVGLEMMVRAGYDPYGAIQAFEILQASERGSLPEFLRDHPMSESRIRTLVEKYRLERIGNR